MGQKDKPVLVTASCSLWTKKNPAYPAMMIMNREHIRSTVSTGGLDPSKFGISLSSVQIRSHVLWSALGQNPAAQSMFFPFSNTSFAAKVWQVWQQSSTKTLSLMLNILELILFKRKLKYYPWSRSLEKYLFLTSLTLWFTFCSMFTLCVLILCKLFGFGGI